MKFGKFEIYPVVILILAFALLLIVSEVETQKTDRLKTELKIKELEVQELQLQLNNKVGGI